MVGVVITLFVQGLIALLQGIFFVPIEKSTPKNVHGMEQNLEMDCTIYCHI